jgi:hypothetical protein
MPSMLLREFPTMNDLVYRVPHYGPYAPVIGLAVLAAVLVALAVAVVRGSGRR